MMPVMKLFVAAKLFFVLLLYSFSGFAQHEYVLAIHGGAGNVSREGMTESLREAYYAVMRQALEVGEEILRTGGSSLDAVEATLRVLEDSPLFNAGRGAVFTIEGTNELDASVMCGRTLDAGAVAGVTTLRNPVTAARKVMEQSSHVLISGKGADLFGYEQGLEVVDPSYYYDQKRWDQYREHLRRSQQLRGQLELPAGMGTVGAVALDKNGNLAAATSTGGMTGKRAGRVGDSPIIGAGTYANNASCAVSATGHGEYFMKHLVAYDISARMIYLSQSLEEAARDVVEIKLNEMGVNGGVIAVDRQGNISMPFTTTAMYRGFVKENGERGIGIFADE